MRPDDIIRFLEAIDTELELQTAAGQKLDLCLIGRSALIVRFGLDLATRDVDIIQDPGSALQAMALDLFGKGTRNAERLGFYLEVVPQGLPPIPGGYIHRSVDIPGPWKVLRPKQPEPHDLAVTKLKRFHPKDREDLRILCDSGELDAGRLKQRLESAFGWAEKDDPVRGRASENLDRVVDYLDGRSRIL
jgi:hypothetical protein